MEELQQGGFADAADDDDTMFCDYLLVCINIIQGKVLYIGPLK